MIYMEPKGLGWRDALVVSWINQSNPSEEEKKILNPLFDWLLVASLQFIRTQCTEVCDSLDSNLVVSLLNIYESQYKAFGFEGADKADSKCIQGLFLFSLVWSVGATVNEAGRVKYDYYLKELLSGRDNISPIPAGYFISTSYPEAGTIYDYVFDKTGNWKLWVDTIPDNFKIPAKAKYDDIMVPTIDTARYSYLIKLLAINNYQILFVGPTGTGKSVYIRDTLMRGLDKAVFVPVFINFSAQTSANQTQGIIESKLDKRRKGIFGPPVGKKAILFVDDLNMPSKETYGAQPPIELLRQWMDHKGWYDLKENQMQTFVDIQFIGAMGPPGGGRNTVTPRVISYNRCYFLTNAIL